MSLNSVGTIYPAHTPDRGQTVEVSGCIVINPGTTTVPTLCRGGEDRDRGPTADLGDDVEPKQDEFQDLHSNELKSLKQTNT